MSKAICTVTLQETYHKLMQKLQESFSCNQSFNNIICNNPIQREDWQDRITTPPHKTLSLHASSPPLRPAFPPCRRPLILCSFVTKHELIRVRHNIRNLVHEDSSQLLIAFQSTPRYTFAGKMDASKSTSKCWNGDTNISSCTELFLDLIEIDDMVLRQYCLDKRYVC
jgi:hypothetical protein